MPIYDQTEPEEVWKNEMGTFQYSGYTLKALADIASEFTLVHIVGDETPSVGAFADGIRQCMINCVAGCKKLPRAENLLIRTTLFNSRDGIKEVHGYRPLSSINVEKSYPYEKSDGTPDKDRPIYDIREYPKLDCKGLTNLDDAAYDMVHSITEYGQKLIEQEFDCNAIGYLIIDGLENASVHATTKMIAEKLSEVEKLRQQEKATLESIVIVVIGVNVKDPDVTHALEQFRMETTFTKYLEMKNADPKSLAEITDFIIRSSSSTSQALGTGKSLTPEELTF